MKNLLFPLLLLSFTGFAQQSTFHKSGTIAKFETMTPIDSGRYIIGGDIYSPSLLVVDSLGIIQSVYRYDALQGPFEYCGFFPTADTGGVLIANGSWNNYVIKLDKELQPQWSRDFGTTKITYAKETQGNGILLTGAENNSGFLAKLDGQGNLLWSRVYTHTQVSIMFNYLESIGNASLLCIGKSQSLNLTKIDTAGNILWSRTFPGIIAATNIIQNDAGEMVFAGIAQFDLTVDLIKIDSVGNIISSVAYDISQSMNAPDIHCLISTNDGGYLIAGENMDAFLIKTDSVGTITWAKKYGAGRSSITQILERADRGYTAIGSTHLYMGMYAGNFMKTDTVGNSGTCVSSFSPQTITSSASIDTFSLTTAVANVVPTIVQVVRDNDFFDFQDTCYMPWSGIEEVSASIYRLFPNPAQGCVYLESDRVAKGIAIYDQLGRIVLRISVCSRTSMIDISDLPPNIYYYKIEFEDSAIVYGKLFVK